eukprot:scaffold101406_cov58-Phaeocystis_antarctica.AAC.3
MPPAIAGLWSAPVPSHGTGVTPAAAPTAAAAAAPEAACSAGAGAGARWRQWKVRFQSNTPRGGAAAGVSGV